MIVAFIYVGLYLLVSIPYVQGIIKERAEKEVSKLIGSKVEIGNLDIHPFNEIRLNDLKVFTPEGEKCITVNTIGAGIHLWRLFYEGKIEITYAEIIGLDGRIWQQKANDPLNIQFIIDAFKPKDKNKPPTKFDLKLHNIVIRRSSLEFSKRWIPLKKKDLFDENHIKIKNLRADLALPKIKNNDFEIDIRRLSFDEKSGFILDRISGVIKITDHSVSVKNFVVKLPQTEVRPSDFSLSFESFKDIKKSLMTGNHFIELIGNKIAPYDFRMFLPAFDRFRDVFTLDLSLSGNLPLINVNNIRLKSENEGVLITAKAEFNDILCNNDRKSISISTLNVITNGGFVKDIISIFNNRPGKFTLGEKLAAVGNIEVSADASISFKDKNGNIEAFIKTGIGDASVISDLSWLDSQKFNIEADISGDKINLSKILNDHKFGHISFHSQANVFKSPNNIDGEVNTELDYIEFNSHRIENILLDLTKEGNKVYGEVNVDDNEAFINANVEMNLAGKDSELMANADIRHVNLSAFSILKKYPDFELSGRLEANIKGNNVDNATGFAKIDNFAFKKDNNEGISLNRFEIRSERDETEKIYSIDSELIKGNLRGEFEFKDVISLLKESLNSALPEIIPSGIVKDDLLGDVTWNFTIYPNNQIADFFKLPIRPYSELFINGNVNVENRKCNLDITAPYLLQGKSKLIRDISLKTNFFADKGISSDILLKMPVKNDNADIEIKINAFDNNIFTDLGWQLEKNKGALGKIDLSAVINKNLLSKTPDVSLTILPSSFQINGAQWKIDESNITYKNKLADIRGLRIWHNDQFVEVDGKASESPDDEIKVSLADIDLSYIFETLNINYVTFGGSATGEVSASRLFSGLPVLKTNHLFIKDMSYNGEVLGDGNIESHWDNEKKMVAINADITEKGGKGAKVNGGVYVTRDSLSFDMIANKVNIGFLKPFMAGFTSDVGGRASGNVKLFGTFKDIDLTGNVLADSISIKVDQTNVYYHGSDSVIMKSGLIEIPAFTLYDKFGNSAKFSGYLKHDYFHNPEFEFKVSEAHNLLCFDTTPRINPDWYGTMFINGNGVLKGRPGVVNLQMDVSTAPNSQFTFVLSETQTAADYTFLTFTDRRKARLEELQGNIDYEEKLRMSLLAKEVEKPTLFTMDIRGDITPNAKMVIVMDPVAGDKIVAYGSGPMQIGYDTDSDEMKIYGKYTLDEGNYNFSLQDLILRDFKINSGSSISFNGDPLQGVLNITASYRVNTNLSDLDKSFSTDRDLNRTNVPVDALLKVNGDMRSPEISFDISLPTLTNDVERKVKSIISTDDMLNRQIIYLLALNRFYTPEYMNTSGSGGELASVASSTISSQLTNIVGQLTDKLTVAPSFRSDKGDFSDMEVDLALSSRLLNNRLLVNGNFGYRDRTTSTTTFVGDFDLEYLLSKNGDLRLKAYNHFNDQNYYLKSSLTTQGIGVIYRHDFNNPFSFLKKRKKKDTGKNNTEKNVKSDSVLIKSDSVLTIKEKTE